MEGEGEKEVEAFIRENLKVEVKVKESWKIRMKSVREEIVVAKLISKLGGQKSSDEKEERVEGGDLHRGRSDQG